LIGHLLGDGSMLIHKAKTIRGSNARFSFTQGLVHKDYFDFVYDNFKQYCNGPAYERIRFTKLTGIFESLVFNTLSLPCFNFYQELFYNSGKKRIPDNIIDFLSPISLSTWIMDDGTFNKRDKILTLCTDSFKKLEIELLLTTLRDKYNLKCRRERKRKSYRIVIIKSSMDTVRDIVSIHFHPSMLYKIGLDSNQ
jgi:hypothetical protein